MTIEKVGRAMSWNLLAKVARFAAGPVSYIIVVRALGSYQWGILSVLKTITAFGLIVATLGGGQALLKYLPSMRVKGGMQSFFRRFLRFLALQTVAWAVIIASAWAARGSISRFYNVESERFSLYLVVAVALILFRIGISMITNILQSWYETKRLGIVIAIGNACYLILMMLLLKAGFGIVGYLAAGAAIDIGMTLFLLPQVVELVRKEGDDGVEAPPMANILKYSLPFVVTGFLNQIVWRHSEVLFLGRWSGMEASGFFGLAYDIPQMALEFVPLTIWPIVMAGTSEIYSRDEGRLPEAIDIYYRLLFLLVLPVAAMGFAFARPMVPLLFGADMSPAALLTQLFFVVFSYSFLYTPLSMALYVMEKSWVNMLVLTFMAVLNIGLDIALIPRYGLWGAFFPVVFVLGVEIAVFSFAIGRFRKDVRAPVGFILKCYAAALPTACLAFISSRYDSPAALIVEMIAGALLLVAGFRILKVLGEKERELILRLPLPFKEKILAII